MTTRPEPPIGSVVLDRDSVAWQRGPHLWSSVKDEQENWFTLNSRYFAPVIIVWQPNP